MPESLPDSQRSSELLKSHQAVAFFRRNTEFFMRRAMDKPFASPELNQMLLDAMNLSATQYLEGLEQSKENTK